MRSPNDGCFHQLSFQMVRLPANDIGMIAQDIRIREERKDGKGHESVIFGINFLKFLVLWNLGIIILVFLKVR